MTNLDTFECPNCGAKVKRPAEGQTTECPYCSADLTAPAAPAPEVVVREVIRERVIEQAPPAVDFRARPPVNARTRIIVVIGVLVAGAVVIMAILSSAQRDSEQRRTQSDAKGSCEKSCKDSCAKEFAEPPAAAGRTEQENAEAQIAKLKRESDKTICESDCTTRCYR